MKQQWFHICVKLFMKIDVSRLHSMMSNSFLYEELFVEQEKARGDIYMWTQGKQGNPTLK